jgi:hypothetical protein
LQCIVEGLVCGEQVIADITINLIEELSIHF